MMDTIIVSEGFGIVHFFLILSAITDPEDSGELPRDSRLTSLLWHICHLPFLDLDGMMSVECLSDEHVSSLLLIVFQDIRVIMSPQEYFSTSRLLKGCSYLICVILTLKGPKKMGIQKSFMCFTVSNPRRTALKDDLADRSSDLIKSKEGIAKL